MAGLGSSGYTQFGSQFFLFSFFVKLFTLLDLCVSSLRRGHANLLCIVPLLTDDPRRESKDHNSWLWFVLLLFYYIILL